VTVRVDVAPELLTWAVQRSGRGTSELAERFPQLDDWTSGTSSPTFKQLEKFAAATYTPLGIMLLPAPPAQEKLPIQDFRTVRDSGVRHASANLLDTIYLCQERQDWYRSYAQRQGLEPLAFVGSLTTSSNPTEAAVALARALAFTPLQRQRFANYTEALAGLRDHAEELGIFVMTSGVVGSNTHRPLDSDEFRGFSLVDDLAPVIFINGADSKAAQIFTLAHELAHVWLGESGVDNPTPAESNPLRVERWCNSVAADLLIPPDDIRGQFNRDEPLLAEATRLARLYKVSTLVTLRSLRDATMITWADFIDAYRSEVERFSEVQRGSGGSFYNTTPVRVSKRFTQAIIGDTVEGATPYGDAFRLLGFHKQAAFDELSRRVGSA
jgi:Zn-dependent peptidase ImmA (M78 family)